MTKRLDAEDRRQQRLRRLRSRYPICVATGESDSAVLDLHHIAGRKHHGDVAIVSANAHRKLSDQQRDHVPAESTPPKGELAKMGLYLLGLGDLFAMIAETLRRFGASMIRESREAGSE
jgi:hypothetical protein